MTRIEVSTVKIFVRVKALGKKKDILIPTEYTIPEGIVSLRMLLTAIVEREVDSYNQKETDVQLIPFLTQEQLDNQAATGKVSFGRVYSDKKADAPKAVANAIQCWEDGLIRVFQNDVELEKLDDLINICENDVFTFIRLTFLAGSMW